MHLAGELVIQATVAVVGVTLVAPMLEMVKEGSTGAGDGLWQEVRGRVALRARRALAIAVRMVTSLLAGVVVERHLDPQVDCTLY